MQQVSYAFLCKFRKGNPFLIRAFVQFMLANANTDFLHRPKLSWHT